MDKGKVIIDFIEKYNNIYNKIIKSEETDENDCKNNLSNEYKNLYILKATFSSADWIPPLLAYYNKFSDERIIEFLQKLQENMHNEITNEIIPWLAEKVGWRRTSKHLEM